MSADERFFRQIVEGLPDPAFAMDSAGRCVYANQATVRAFQSHEVTDGETAVRVNLVGNAVKLTAAGEVTLDVGAWSSNGVWKLIFTVTDTGIDIPADKMDRLCETFSQVDASTTREPDPLDAARLAELCEMSGGDMEFVAQIVDLFLEDAPAGLADLRASAREGAFDRAARHAHGLKGSASNVGASGARALAERLEAAAHDGDAGKALDLADAFERELERIGEASERLM